MDDDLSEELRRTAMDLLYHNVRYWDVDVISLLLEASTRIRRLEARNCTCTPRSMCDECFYAS